MTEYAWLQAAWVTMGTLACLSLLEEPPPVAVEPQPGSGEEELHIMTL